MRPLKSKARFTGVGAGSVCMTDSGTTTNYSAFDDIEVVRYVLVFVICGDNLPHLELADWLLSSVLSGCDFKLCADGSKLPKL
jgi:hypothetical protein